MTNEVDDDDYNYEYEGELSFCGPCTCEHELEEHGYIFCNVEGCKCEAHWEE